MSNNQPNRPQSRQQQAPWQCPTSTQNPSPQSSRPGVHRSNTVEITVVGEIPGTFIMSPRSAEVALVITNDRGGHIRGSGRGGGGGGRGRGQGGRQMRIDHMLPVVANRIAETQGDNRQGALNARSPRDGGRGRERPSSDTEIRHRSGEGRPQRGERGGQAGEWPPLRGQGSGRESPSQWPSDERRGSPGARDGERPSHNRLDEATLSSDPARATRAQVANETLKVLYDENYTTAAGAQWDLRHAKYELAKGTKFYSANNSSVSAWHPKGNVPFDPTAEVDFVEQSTVAAARSYAIQKQYAGKVGVLNFASATKRGGGFKNGAQAQEESLARASTLYFSLTQPDANKFYETHIKSDHKGFYSHAMIYSRNVTLFRDENDRFVDPSAVNIVTSAAVNAGSVRRKAGKKKPEEVEDNIYFEMFERMGRILKCFEENGDKVLVLGSFGTGVFQNDIGMVACIWAQLLGHGGRFSQSFDRVEFAILGRSTYEQFQNAYNNELSEQVVRSLRAAEKARP